MPISNDYERLALSEIKIDRQDRQRKEIVTDDLKPSISLYGVLNPIIITRDRVLVAGERRYTASLQLGLPDIPVRFLDTLSTAETIIIELEENIKRKGLSWKEEVDAVNKVHNLYLQNDPTWNLTRTSEVLGMSISAVSRYIAVSAVVDSPKVSAASTMQQAINIVEKTKKREADRTVNDIMESLSPKKETPEAPKPQDQTLLLGNFLEWARTYDGQPFNFIHCDFPYGINVFASDSSGRRTAETYDDSEDVYWALLDTLCKHRDSIMSYNAHMMFWFSMEHYEATLKFFQQNAPDLVVQKFPLVWFKSDNVGIVPDAKRGPRRVYETALILSRNDRHVFKVVANTYASPTDRLYHPSTKPEPMLRHFFQLFVDEHTRMLDPTCGSGSSIRAAESMNAAKVLGIESSEEHFKNAETALRKFRALRSI